MSDEAADFKIEWSPQQAETIKPATGGSFRRMADGDYDFEVTALAQVPREDSTKPPSLAVTSRILKAYDTANVVEVGGEMTTRYQPHATSHEFAQRRFAAFLSAVGAKHDGQGNLMASSIRGKRFTASIIWEIAKQGKMGEDGTLKKSVYANMIGERKLGAPRPSDVDPARQSAEAKKYLAKQEEGDEVDQGPWNAAANMTPAPTEPAASPATSSFLPEDQLPESAHTYRAFIKLGDSRADQARALLLDNSVDPDGPVNPALIDDADTKAAFMKKFGEAPKAASGLPPLTKDSSNSGKLKTGTRQPRV